MTMNRVVLEAIRALDSQAIFRNSGTDPSITTVVWSRDNCNGVMTQSLLGQIITSSHSLLYNGLPPYEEFEYYCINAQSCEVLCATDINQYTEYKIVSGANFINDIIYQLDNAAYSHMHRIGISDPLYHLKVLMADAPHSSEEVGSELQDFCQNLTDLIQEAAVILYDNKLSLSVCVCNRHTLDQNYVCDDDDVSLFYELFEGSFMKVN